MYAMNEVNMILCLGGLALLSFLLRLRSGIRPKICRYSCQSFPWLTYSLFLFVQ